MPKSYPELLEEFKIEQTPELKVEEMYAHDVVYILNYLSENQILDQNNAASTIRLLCQNQQQATELKRALEILQSEGLLRKEFVDFFLQDPSNAKYISFELKFLKQNGIPIDELIKLSYTNISHISHLYSGLNILKKNDLLTSEIVELLLIMPGEASNLVLALIFLKKESQLHLDYLIKLLRDNPMGILSLKTGLEILKQEEILHDTWIECLRQNPQYAPELAAGLGILNREKMLQDNQMIEYLHQNLQYAPELARGLVALKKERIFENKLIIILLENPKHIQKLAAAFVLLSQANILQDDLIAILGKNLDSLEECAKGMQTLQNEGVLTEANFRLLIEHSQYNEILTESLIYLQQKRIFHLFKQNTKDESLGALLIFLKLIPNLSDEEYIHLATKTDKDIYQLIYSDNTQRFDEHIKMLAFFMAHHEKSIAAILSFLPSVKPIHLINYLKEILQTSGAYNLLPDPHENLTIGFEIEYSNVASHNKQLTEFGMHIIQKNWSHPGDGSVIKEENSYGGEATTPIIFDNKDLRSAMLNIAFLKAMGGATNASCGFHVHVGIKNIKTPSKYLDLDKEIIEEKSVCTNYQLEFMKQFLIIYKREELKFAPIEREPNEYIKPVVIIPANIQDIHTFFELLQQVNPENRHYEINFHAFLKHGTIEVRRFAGSTEESEIYATVAMIVAIAKEARARTDDVFNARKKVPTEIETEVKIDSSSQVEPKSVLKNKTIDELPSSFITQRKTEIQTELFKLRVKAVNECTLKIATKEEAKQEISKNTVYVYLNSDVNLTYIFYNKKGKPTTGIIENDKRFGEIFTKLTSHTELTPKEKNQILCEVSTQSAAPVTQKVKKFSQMPNLLSKIGKKAEQKPLQNQTESTDNPANDAQTTVKHHK